VGNEAKAVLYPADVAGVIADERNPRPLANRHVVAGIKQRRLANASRNSGEPVVVSVSN
jgi:hypothetical protein